MGEFIIYKSSAGSGKTFTLIRTFLTFALRDSPGSQFKRVLALTFTTKAATEMRERLLYELHKIKTISVEEGLKDAFITQLLESLSIGFEELRKRSNTMFHAVLQDYGDLSIGTIDQFNHRLIRAFSRDLALSGDWAVETKDEKYFLEAIQRVIGQVGSDPHMTHQLLRFVEMRVDEEEQSDPAKALESYKDLVLKEDAIPPLEHIESLHPDDFAEIEQKFRLYARTVRETLQAHGRSMLELLKGIGFGTAEIAHGNQGVYGFLNKLAEGNFPTEIGKRTLEACEGTWLTKVNIKKLGSTFDTISTELTAALNATCAYLEPNVPLSLLCEKLANDVPLMATLGRIYESFNALLTERNVQTISRFNRIIADTLIREPAAFIYERYGARYDHILIDEFQDTSALQWYNLLPLIEEGLSRAKSSMVVGDAKQSIYRWRSGKAEQLIALPLLFDAPEQLDDSVAKTIERTHSLRSLDENFRSEANIIKFNNLIFSELAAIFDPNDLYAKEYHPSGVQQKIRPGKTGGYVEINVQPHDKKNPYQRDFLLRQIAQCKAANYAYGDMAILVRSTRNEGAEIAEMLVENGIPVQTSDSFALDANNGVNFLIQCFRLTDREQNNLAATGFLRTLSTRHGIAFAPERYTEAGNINLMAFLRENELPEWRSSFAEMPAFELCTTLISTYWNGESNVYLDAFQGYVLSEIGFGGSTASLMRKWDELEPHEKPSLPAQVKADAIEILTIHKSKGLEFPVVFVPELHWEKERWKKKWAPLDLQIAPKLKYGPFVLTKANKNAMPEYLAAEQRANLFDQLNLIYVALTRAAKALFIGYQPSDSKVSGMFNQALMQIQEQLRANFERYHLVGDIGDSFSLKLGNLDPYKEKAKANEAYTPIAQPGRHLLPTTEIELATVQSRAQLIGRSFHEMAVATKSDTLTEQTLEKAAERFTLSGEEAQSIRLRLESLQQDSWYASLLSSGEVLAERDIAWEGNVLRPDLVVEAEARVSVVDFKTGEERPSHFEQIQKYQQALSALTGKPTRAFLIYFEPYRVVEAQERPAIQGELFS